MGVASAGAGSASIACSNHQNPSRLPAFLLFRISGAGAPAAAGATFATPEMSRPEPLSAFRPVPRTGVIYVTAEATRAGFKPEDPSWCNLGQGQPETGPLPGAPER